MSAPVAIVGMACRFPGGADDPDAFWQLLVEGRDAITTMDRAGLDLDELYDPAPRTPGRMATRSAGLLTDLERFDAAFFGISPREAATLDPEQRLLLETTWEACEDATIDPRTLAGQAVGVFVGQWTSDFESRLFADTDQLDFHATTGSGRYATSGRLSFAFGALGPSLTIDTACSSSLVAVHLACQSLRAGESRFAIAGGVNVILQPHITIAYSQGGMMAPDGRCKFGDAKGDGYVRSEGAGVVLLELLDDALADGDRVRAVIRGSAVNNDGGTSGHLGRPSREGQAAMLRSAYRAAAVDPGRVGYVEAHGTGTRAGDPVELSALGDVVAPGRGPDDRCLLGSVKTNIGHAEAAAGMAGLLKCVLALEHGEVPASLHLDEPNPAIPWAELPFEVPTSTVPWPSSDGARRVAGVTGFGISGTNAHVVLEEAPEPAPPLAPGDDRPLLLVLSAAAPTALRALAASYADILAGSDANAAREVCATAARHRAALGQRAAFVAADPGALTDRLRRFAAGEDEAADALGTAGATAHRLALVLPGQGGQWAGMARELLATEPVVRAAVADCDEALPAWVSWTVREQLLADPADAAYRLDEIGVIQPVLLAVEIALAALWRSWGITPDAVVGHSMGEVAAALLAGALTLDEAMRIICLRSALMQRTSGAGAMAALELSIEETEARIARHGDRVGIAVSNNPRSTVVSGDADVVAAVLAECKGDQVFGRAVKVDVASHSTHMDPLVPELVGGLADLDPRPSSVALYSTVDADLRPGDAWDSTYWGRNLRRPVRFAATLERMLAAGTDTFLEVGPHPTLLASVTAVGDEHGVHPLGVASLRRSAPERESLLASLGALWVTGHTVDWEALFPAGTYRRVPVPHYPWQRERHWSDAAQPVPPVGARRAKALDESLRAWLHVTSWVPAPLTADQRAGGDWLVVGAQDDGAASLGAALTGRGASVHVVPTTPAAARWVENAAADGHAPVAVVLLLAAEARPFDVVAAVQALQATPAVSAPPRLWWVTRGAQVVAGEVPAGGTPMLAAAWGAARVMASEHPDWWGGLVDLDPAQDPGEQADVLARHLAAGDDEDLVAVRAGERHGLRLAPAAEGTGAPPAPAWRTDAAYLVTGGLGGIGREITRSMVRDGARRLVLVGRTPLPPRSTWSSVDEQSDVGRRVAAVRALEHAGASVHLVTADVADEEQLRTALDEYAREGWPPIAGVIHLAAALESGLTGDLDQASFERVLRPKLDGALVLDRLLPDVQRFVVFSSIAAFWAPVGMAGYVAANAGIDALVQARRASGRPALSIQWGPWAGVGLLEHSISDRAMDELTRDGVGTMTAGQGTELFAALMGRDEPVIAVLPVDWSVFFGNGRAGHTSLFRAFAGGDAAPSHGRGSADELSHAALAERRAGLERIVCDALGGVLRLPAARIDRQRHFGSLGLDSIMGLELRNRLERALQRPLSATLAWNYPTVDALTAYLDALIAPVGSPTGPDAAATDAAPPTGTTPVDTGLATLLAELTSITDDDAARALREVS